MAPTCRGRKPTLPQEFIEDHGWKMVVKKRKGNGKKDKYWRNLKTGKICRSANEVKDILKGGGIYYTMTSPQTKGASCETTVAKPAPNIPASKELSQEFSMDVATDAAPEQNTAVAQPGNIIDNNSHGDGGMAVAPPAGDIIGNNAHHDGGQEEAAAQEQQHHGRRMESFDLN